MTQSPQSSLGLREQMKALENLQELDLKIDSLKKKKDLIPVTKKTLEDTLSRIRTTLETKKTVFGELEKNKRQNQAALDMNNDRLTRANSKLEAVQNSQEFQAANKEIEQVKKMNHGLDEQIKKLTQDQENIQKDIVQLQSEFEKVDADCGTQLKTLNEQEGQLDGDIRVLVGERKQHTSGVEPRIIALYERVRGARAGVAVVPAVGGRCKGCNMMVPPQLFNEIQRATTFHSCPSCHRILLLPSQGQQPATGLETAATGG